MIHDAEALAVVRKTYRRELTPRERLGVFLEIPMVEVSEDEHAIFLQKASEFRD